MPREHSGLQKNKMLKLSLTVLILYYLSLHYGYEHKESNINFDVVVFSQQWPITACKSWLHKNPNSHCVLPSKKNQWTVHGIWPMTMDGRYPEHCNNSWAFDPEQIKSIEVELQQAWTNIHKETAPDAFWKYEWEKHGVCAMSLETLNSQYKYFSQAIVWHKEYYLLDMLDAAKIYPSDTKKYVAKDFVNAILTAIKKVPLISCVTIDGLLYLEEIHFCFDKELNLNDCDPVEDRCGFNEFIFPANA